MATYVHEYVYVSANLFTHVCVYVTVPGLLPVICSSGVQSQLLVHSPLNIHIPGVPTQEVP